MRKRLISILVVVALITSIFSLSGCGTSDTSKSDDTSNISTKSKSTKAPEKTTIRLMTRWGQDNDMGKAFFAALDKFKEQHPEIIIQDESVPGNDDKPYYDKIKTAAATGDMYEIVQNYGGSQLVGYVQNDLFLDLQPELDKDTEWKNGFKDIFDIWQYSDKKGTYGVPANYFGVLLYYNKDLFKKFNLEVPKTIDEFEAVSEVFKKNGIVPMAMSAKDNWRHAHLATNLAMKKYGFDLVKGLSDRKQTYAGAEMQDIFGMIKKWQDKGIFGENIMSFSYDQENTMFCSGKSAMHQDGPWEIANIQSINPDLIKDQKIGVAVFPYFKDKAELKGSMMGGPDGGYSIANTKDEAKKNAAVTFLKHITNGNTAKELFEVSGGAVFPAQNFQADASKVTYLISDFMNILTKDAEVLKQEIDSYDKVPGMEGVFRNSIQGMLAGGTPADAGKQIDEHISKAGK